MKGCNTLFKDQGGGKFEAASTCNVGGVIVVSNGVTTYNKDHDSVHAETQAKYSPAFNGKTDEVMTEDQHYLGVCPVGMKPGDIMGADGLIRRHD